MMKKESPGESEQAEAKRLETEIASLALELEACKENVRQFTLAERPLEGLVYAQELHQARQNKVRIETEILLRRNRLRKISWSGPVQ